MSATVTLGSSAESTWIGSPAESSPSLGLRALEVSLWDSVGVDVRTRLTWYVEASGDEKDVLNRARQLGAYVLVERATFAAAYAVRARPGAPVSAPCTWDEVERGDAQPRSFTLLLMAGRFARIGDRGRTCGCIRSRWPRHGRRCERCEGDPRGEAPRRSRTSKAIAPVRGRSSSGADISRGWSAPRGLPWRAPTAVPQSQRQPGSYASRSWSVNSRKVFLAMLADGRETAIKSTLR